MAHGAEQALAALAPFAHNDANIPYEEDYWALSDVLWTPADADVVVLVNSLFDEDVAESVLDRHTFLLAEVLADHDRTANHRARSAADRAANHAATALAAARGRVRRRACGLSEKRGNNCRRSLVPAHWILGERGLDLFSFEGGEPGEPEILNDARLAHELGGDCEEHGYRASRYRRPVD
jgi:hypothetical protein